MHHTNKCFFCNIKKKTVNLFLFDRSTCCEVNSWPFEVVLLGIFWQNINNWAFQYHSIDIFIISTLFGAIDVFITKINSNQTVFLAAGRFSRDQILSFDQCGPLHTVCRFFVFIFRTPPLNHG